MLSESFIFDNVETPRTFLSYVILAEINKAISNQEVVETSVYNFLFEGFAEKGHCKIEIDPQFLNQIPVYWSHHGAQEHVTLGSWKVTWQGHDFQVVRTSWETNCGSEQRHWIVAPSRQIAIDFFSAVCTWADERKQVINVFAEGYWRQCPDLYKAIQSSNLDSLIMPAKIKAAILDDFDRFIKSKENYAKYGAAWKRGVLFMGPPGNGKTHFIRALVRHLDIPCFYVKSFETGNNFKSAGIQAVYETVRRAAPAILVLEDLDSLINDDNRTYFLNELDGFEDNNGIITIATTNHPQKLDTAILDRPSRFDQKWNFGLPEFEERLAFISRWSEQLPENVGLSLEEARQIANETQDFSFAYLKELCLGSILKWVRDGEQGSLAKTFQDYRQTLQQQSPRLTTDAAT